MNLYKKSPFTVILNSMKHQTGKKINSRSLVADSKKTSVCIFSSFPLLIGLNYLYGFWHADPMLELSLEYFY